MFAACPPVTNPTDADDGSPRISFSHPPATSSNARAAGDIASLKAHWSQPAARTSATSAASTEPPVTKPKYLGPADVVNPGDAAATSSSITSPSGVGPSRSSPRARRTSALVAPGVTLAAANPSRYSAIRSAAPPSASRRSPIA